MTKNLCPFRDSCNRCTHKSYENKGKSLKICNYKNELKCFMHNQWLKERKSLKMATNEDTKVIKGWMNELKQRWLK